MDMEWIISQNMQAVADGLCPKKAVYGILNSIAESELDTVRQYNMAKIAIAKMLKDMPKARDAICKIIDNIIEDEGDHCASAQKASAACIGIKAPKPTEYEEIDNDEQASI